MEMTTDMTEKNSTETTVNTEALRQALEQDRQARGAACKEVIEKALKDTNCRLIAITTIVDNQIVQRIEVVANG